MDQLQINNLRTSILQNLFPEEMVTAVIKSAQDLDTTQFQALYKFLITERVALIKLYEEDDTSPMMLNGIDQTIAILKAKYAKA